MPPALSEAGSSDAEDDRQSVSDVPAKRAGSEEAESGDDDGEDEDEYVVERILQHRFIKGSLQFQVKWQGYDKPEDLTWEPESNMESAFDVMQEYFDKLGGRPVPKGGQKRKGRQSEAKSEAESSASIPKRPKKEKAWEPPRGSWEHEVKHIDTVELNKNPETGAMEKFGYLVWENGKKSQHPLRHIYAKCPQKMLLYYESHLVFTDNTDLPDAEDVSNGV